VNPPPPAESNSRVDGADGHPGIKRLLACYHARLVTGQRAQTRRDYATHVDEYVDYPRQSNPPSASDGCACVKTCRTAGVGSHRPGDKDSAVQRLRHPTRYRTYEGRPRDHEGFVHLFDS
jgi:hypothetical protein